MKYSCTCINFFITDVFFWTATQLVWTEHLVSKVLTPSKTVWFQPKTSSSHVFMQRHNSVAASVGMSNSFGAVGHIYALSRGPDNFAHNYTIDTFIYYFFIALQLKETWHLLAFKDVKIWYQRFNIGLRCVSVNWDRNWDLFKFIKENSCWQIFK